MVQSFRALDVNGDGTLSRAEFEAGMPTGGPRTTSPRMVPVGLGDGAALKAGMPPVRRTSQRVAIHPLRGSYSSPARLLPCPALPCPAQAALPCPALPPLSYNKPGCC